MKFAVLFDMDGVIIDSNPFHKIALKEFCKRHGYDLTEEHLLTKIYGRTNKEWITNLFGTLPAEALAQYANEKEEMFRELYKVDIKPVTGLLSFLDELQQRNVPRTISTSAPRSNVDFTLKHIHIGKYFQTILDESYVTQGKPNPEIYLKSAMALGIEPEHCVVIEDSLSGVQAGQAAGCKVIGITTTHTRAELSHTDLVIDDFTQLKIEDIEKIFVSNAVPG